MFKNKKILIILFLIIILFFSNTFVFAAGEDENVKTTFSNNQVDFIKQIYYKYSKDYDSFVCKLHNGEYNFYLYNETPGLYFYIDEGRGMLCSSLALDCRFVATNSSGTVIYDNINDDKYGVVEAYADVLNGRIAVLSNHNIYKGNSTETLFFQYPPLTLAPVLEEQEMEGILQEIILILPLILVVVVSFLGLRKALQMLSTLLHRLLII